MKKFLGCALLCFFCFSCQKTETDNFLVGIQIQDRNGVSETVSIPDKLEVYNKTDFLSAQPFKKVIRVYKKEGKSHSIITTYHPNGLIWKYLEAQDMRASGLYKEWFPTGQLKVEAYVIGGSADVGIGAQSDWLFDGLSRVWDEQGNLIAEIPYEKGSLEGVTRNFYPTGQIEREAPYKQNLLEGAVVEYFLDGRIKRTVSYQKGLKQGLSAGYDIQGTVCWTEEYREDLLQNGSYFASDGEKISSVQDGFGFQTFFEDSLAFQQIEIRKGKQEGTIKQFSPEKELKLCYQLKNGKKHGAEISYYQSSELEQIPLKPAPKLSIEWNEDAIHGLVKTWYKNGSLESQKEWARNKKNGNACSWYLDGSLMLIEEYEDDLLSSGKYFKRAVQDPVSSVTMGNGLATLYDENGIFLQKVIYHKGRPVDPEN